MFVGQRGWTPARSETPRKMRHRVSVVTLTRVTGRHHWTNHWGSDRRNGKNKGRSEVDHEDPCEGIGLRVGVGVGSQTGTPGTEVAGHYVEVEGRGTRRLLGSMDPTRGTGDRVCPP